MADMLKLTAADYAIGVGVLLVWFVVFATLDSAFELRAPSWLLGGVSAAVGVPVWFAIVRNRRKGV